MAVIVTVGLALPANTQIRNLGRAVPRVTIDVVSTQNDQVASRTKPPRTNSGAYLQTWADRVSFMDVVHRLLGGIDLRALGSRIRIFHGLDHETTCGVNGAASPESNLKSRGGEDTL